MSTDDDFVFLSVSDLKKPVCDDDRIKASANVSVSIRATGTLATHSVRTLPAGGEPVAVVEALCDGTAPCACGCGRCDCELEPSCG